MRHSTILPLTTAVQFAFASGADLTRQCPHHGRRLFELLVFGHLSAIPWARVVASRGPQLARCRLDQSGDFGREQCATGVNTTPQMTHFRDAKVCNKWLQVRIDDHRIQSDYKYKSELQNPEGKKSLLGITSAW